MSFHVLTRGIRVSHTYDICPQIAIRRFHTVTYASSRRGQSSWVTPIDPVNPRWGLAARFGRIASIIYSSSFPVFLFSTRSRGLNPRSATNLVRLTIPAATDITAWLAVFCHCAGSPLLRLVWKWERFGLVLYAF